MCSRGVEWRDTILRLKAQVALSCDEQLDDGRMPSFGRQVQWRTPILHVLNINGTASCNQLFRDLHMPLVGRDKEWQDAIEASEVDVAASLNSRVPCSSSLGRAGALHRSGSSRSRSFALTSVAGVWL